MYLPGQPRGALPFRSRLGREWWLMSSYEEMMIILTIALLIVAILEYVSHKK